MPPRARLLGFAVAATMLAATAGCGGSSTKSKQSSGATNAAGTGTQPPGTSKPATAPAEPPIPVPTGKPLTRARLIATADTICRRLNAQAASIKVRSSRDLSSTAPRLSSYYRTAFAELRKLTPPASMASDWNAILADIQPLANEIVTVGRYAAANDNTSIARVEKRIASMQLYRFTIAKRNGFTDCAEA